MTEATQSLDRRMAKGAVWTISTRIGVRLLGIVSMVVLARLLVPDDFGLVGLANMVVGILAVLTALGFDVVLIQNQQAERAHYDTVWTLTVIRNAAIAVFVVVFAPAVAAFFEEPRLAEVLYWLALGTLIAGFGSVATVNFRKDLTFHKDFIFMVGAKLGMVMVSLPLAFLWRDYRALIAGTLAATVVSLLLGYAMAPYRPRFTLQRWREIMDFSKWLLLNNVIGFVYRSGDGLVIGKMIGTQALGLYSMANEIASLASAELLAPIRRALLPGYSKISDDPDALAKSFTNVFALALLFVAPMAAGIGLVADPLVRLALGDKWLEAIPLIQVLAVHGLISVLMAGSGPIYLAVGKPHLRTLVTTAGLVCLLPALYLGISQAGIVGAAWAVVVARGATVTVDLVMILRLLRLPPWRLLQVAWRSLLGVAVMAAVVIEVLALWPAPEAIGELFLLLGTASAAGALTYLASHLLLWRLTGVNPLAALRDA